MGFAADNFREGPAVDDPRALQQVMTVSLECFDRIQLLARRSYQLCSRRLVQLGANWPARLNC